MKDGGGGREGEWGEGEEDKKRYKDQFSGSQIVKERRPSISFDGQLVVSVLNGWLVGRSIDWFAS